MKVYLVVKYLHYVGHEVIGAFPNLSDAVEGLDREVASDPSVRYERHASDHTFEGAEVWPEQSWRSNDGADLFVCWVMVQT